MSNVTFVAEWMNTVNLKSEGKIHIRHNIQIPRKFQYLATRTPEMLDKTVFTVLRE